MKRDAQQTPRGALGCFLHRYRVAVVVQSGPARGTEYTVGQERLTFGRGPGVDLALDHKDIAREHAVIEFWGDAFVLRDLDTQFGVALNGGRVCTAQLKNGDRFRIGDLEFQFVLEERRPQGRR
jgi:pSer/pThr/pTyr-binding forkhead associated (FHA) protein